MTVAWTRDAMILWALTPALLLAGPACERDDLGDDHPVDVINYPVGVTADPSGRIVWVTSGNYDLAYLGGAVLAIDVATHEFVTATDSEGEEQPVAFMVGGFPGPLHILERDGRAVAGYVLSREHDALYHVRMWGDPEAPLLDCPDGARVGTGILKCLQKGSVTFDEVLDEDGEEVLVELGFDRLGELVHHAGPGESEDLLLTGAMLGSEVATFSLDVVGTPTLLGELDIGEETA